jgi:chromosome segregation ATPase
MKNAFSALLLLSLLAPVSAMAKEDGQSGKATTTLSDIREKVREEVKDRIEDRRASSTASSTAHRVTVRQEVAKRLVEHAAKVLMATAERLSKIGDRVQSRIEKVKAEGGDTFASEKALADARGHIADAKTKLASFSSIDLSAERISDSVEALRTAAQSVKEDLKAARASLSEAISSLKPGRSGKNATSTATSTRDN